MNKDSLESKQHFIMHMQLHCIFIVADLAVHCASLCASYP